MNTRLRSINRFQNRRGVALIIVLSVLVLLSALLVAFMSNVSSERVSSKAVISGFEARQAAESAVNLVISQIREATRDPSGEVGWACQPGLFRTFRAGKDEKVFKLYSNPRMQETASSYKPDSTDESGFDPSSPGTVPPGMVDLNEAILAAIPDSPEVDPIYPIADPDAKRTKEGTQAVPPSSLPLVEGFNCADIIHPTNKKARGGKTIYSLPMRVHWLYQLRDGSIVAADAQGNLKGATKENPPIARMAFWTDDDSGKLNINTAGENTYWDTPMACTYEESGRVDGAANIQSPTDPASLRLAASQPAQGEYQRFPGHPATTNLSTVLRGLFPPNWEEWRVKEAIYRLIPRVTGGTGTSVGGTQNAWMIYFNPSTGTKLPNVNDPRVYDRDRLFASVDEFWFRPDRSPLNLPSLYTVFRDVPTTQTPAMMPPWVKDGMGSFVNNTQNLNASLIEKMRFFMTASSRAPDITLSGTPRVCIWPMYDQQNPFVGAATTDRRSAFDDLIAFCSTINQKSYYFARKDPWSPTYDFEQAGRNFGEAGPTQRNLALFKYLQDLTNAASPAASASFAGKYGPDRDQILLEIFDYIRSTNLVDSGNKNNALAVGAGLSTGQYPLAYTPGYDTFSEGATEKYTGNLKGLLGSGQVAPTVSTVNGQKLRGFGRFPTISEAALIFFVDRGENIAGFDTEEDPDRNDPNDVPIRCILATEMYTPSPGYPALSEGYAYTVTEGGLLPGITSIPFEFVSEDGAVKVPFLLAANQANYVEVDPWRVERSGNRGRFYMPTRGIANHFVWDSPSGRPGDALALKSPNKDSSLTPATYDRFPFFSKKYWVPAKRNANGQGTTRPTDFKFTAGKLSYDIRTLQVPDAQRPAGHPPAGDSLQKVLVDFETPSGRVPVPAEGATTLQAVISHLAATSGHDATWDAYTVRSVEVGGTRSQSDNRVVAGLYDVPSNMYAPAGVGKYNNQALRQVHNLRGGWGSPFRNNGADWNATSAIPASSPNNFGHISSGIVSRPDKIVDIHAAITGVKAPGGGPIGDYDRGWSKQLDGAFINKPDEGNVRFNTGDDLGGGGAIPYFRGGNGYDEVGANFFSPNRIISSPIMFGSLPSGIHANRPWETLLFCPPLANHRGGQSVPDHYLLDLFNMPVVEPYAISEPLSTGGRINLNHRLAPFGYRKSGGKSYIERATGLYAVLKGMRQLAIPSQTIQRAKNESPLNNSTSGYRFRREVDPALTISDSINKVLDSSRGYFRTASEICDVDLLLKPPTGNLGSVIAFTNPSSRQSFWAAHDMTGDNGRERPYSHIYPRLTTKSNVFTVHVWTQSISKAPSNREGDWEKFNEDRDQITGEYRGSTTIERYLDPNDEALKKDGYDATKKIESLEPYYRFRVLNTKRLIAQ